MQVTIIRDDSAVIVDGVRFDISAVSLLSAEVHAIQWDGVRGEVEYAYTKCAHCGVGSKKPNEAITQFKVGDTPLQPLLEAWTQAKAAWDTEQARIAAEHEAAMNDQAQRDAAEQPEPQA